MSLELEALILSDPLRFIPPKGPDAEWPPVEEWIGAEWAHWLREHNRYKYLTPWTDEAIHQYITVDRYKYGLGFGRQQGKVDQWFYNPAPVAVRFHQSKTRNILFGGAAGGTKSYSALFDALRHAFAIPGFRAIIMRRTLEELRRNHLDVVETVSAQINTYFEKEVCEYYKDKEVRVVSHPNGEYSRVVFGHCQRKGDEKIYLGDAYDAYYPDEMATFHQDQIIGVQGRLRTKKRGLIPRMAGTSNPGGSHTLWLRDFFITKNEAVIRQKYPKYRADRHEFIPAMLYDNPYYMDPDGTYDTYEERLFAHDPIRRWQLLLGDWSALSGQFFPEFSEATHVADISIPSGCKIERWVDWGYDPHYGIVQWVALLPNGRIYVFAEWRFNGEHAKERLVASEVAKRTRDLTHSEMLPLAKSNRVSRSIADPSMWGKDGHSGEDYAETFRKNGVVLQRADNDRILGWGRLRHWFRKAPDELPWMMFHPRCVTTIRSIPTLVRDENDPADVNTEGEDHPADALRYGVMGRPSPSRFKEESIVLSSEAIGNLISSLQDRSPRLYGMVG